MGKQHYSKWGYVIADHVGLWVPEFHSRTFQTFDETLQVARAYANEHDETVYIWDVDTSWEAGDKPVKKVAPFHATPGTACSINMNQGLRDATILAYVDDKALIEYEMPNGTTSLRIVDKDSCLKLAYDDRVIQDYGRGISYLKVPKKFLQAMIEHEITWEATPQKKRGHDTAIPCPTELLPPTRTRAAATPRAVLVVDVASLPAVNALADEFAEIEQFMAISDKFHLTEVGGKMTLLPREPLVINIDDDGYGWTSGGLF